MTQERFNEHFSSDAAAWLLVCGKGAPRRLDGRPLTAADRAIIRARRRQDRRGAVALQKLADEYQAKFSNWDSIAHPSILTDRRFTKLVSTAITVGKSLTRAQLDRVFGGIAWEE